MTTSEEILNSVRPILDKNLAKAVAEFEEIASGRVQRLEDLSADIRAIEKLLAAYPVPPFQASGIGFSNDGRTLQLFWGDKKIDYGLADEQGGGREGRLLGAPAAVRLFVAEHGLLVQLIEQAKRMVQESQ